MRVTPRTQEEIDLENLIPAGVYDFEVVKAEDKIEERDRMSQFSYYKRSTLPENTDVNALTCSLDNSKLTITAPIVSDLKASIKQIPIQSIKN